MTRVGFLGRRALAYGEGIRSVEGILPSLFFDPDPSTHSAALELGLHLAQSEDDLVKKSDAVVIGSPMPLHASQAIKCLKQDRHVLSEVTAATSLDDCWRLLAAAEASQATYSMAENYCFFPENLLIKALVAEGLFGSLTFGEGDYVHDVRSLHFHSDGSPTWRAFWQMGVRGNTYITHEIGPVMQWMTLADQHDRISTVSCLGTGPISNPDLPQDDTTITLCQLESGRLIKARLDMASSRPEMICTSLQGTQGVYESSRGAMTSHRVWFGEGIPGEHREWRSLDDFWDVLDSETRSDIEAAKSSGHGGGDYLTGRDFAKSLQSGYPFPIGIHEALEWTAAGLCSQISIMSGGVPIQVPDFRHTKDRPKWLEVEA